MIRKNLKIIVALAIIAGILLALKIISNSSLSLISSIPENNKDGVEVNTTVKFVFDKKIASQDWQISSSPVFLFQTKIQDKSLEVIPEKPLEENTAYRLEISNKKYPRFKFVLSFKTATVAVEAPQTTPPYTYEEVKKYYDDWNTEIHKNEPLYDFMPYKTANYFIYYLKPLTLQVVTKKDTPALRKEVDDWIRSKGVDPATHTIEWKISETLSF